MQNGFKMDLNCRKDSKWTTKAFKLKIGFKTRFKSGISNGLEYQNATKSDLSLTFTLGADSA